MAGLTIKSYGAPDETRSFVDKGHVDIFRLGSATVGRTSMEPGWRWSEHVGPIAKTKRCEMLHRGYCVAGRMTIEMADGEKGQIGPGDSFEIQPGHDAYVEGDEAFVSYDFEGMKEYAKPAQREEAAVPPSIH